MSSASSSDLVSFSSFSSCDSSSSVVDSPSSSSLTSQSVKSFRPVISVYRFQVFHESCNHYTTDRSERWSVNIGEYFDDLQAAREYVRNESRKSTELPVFLCQLRESMVSEPESVIEAAVHEFIDEFCFYNDLYANYRRYFIGKPPLAAIKKSLQAVRISVALN
jgi:hypothetical protein